MGRPATVGNRRPVRTVIERVHATHGRGRVRRADPGQTPTPHHGWHHRRRDRIECHCRSNMERTRDHATSIVLRSRKRWNRWRKQEHGEDRGQPHRPIRPGLLRLRLEEVRVDDRVSSAVLTRSDRVHLSCRSGRLRCLSPASAARPQRCARACTARSDAAAQCITFRRRFVAPLVHGKPAHDSAEGSCRLGSRCRCDRCRRRPRRPNQHRATSVFLCTDRSDGDHRSRRSHQTINSVDLWQAGSDDC